MEEVAFLLLEIIALLDLYIPFNSVVDLISIYYYECYIGMASFSAMKGGSAYKTPHQIYIGQKGDS